MAIIDNLNTLSTNLDNAKFKLAKNLKNKGVQALPSEKLDALADKVSTISGGGACNLQELNVTENGVYTPQAGDVKGYNKVTVNVPQSGGGDIDWSGIGYSSTPKEVVEGYNYSKNIYDTWDATQTDLSSKFADDKSLLFAPNVNLDNVTLMESTFENCINLISVPDFKAEKCTSMYYLFANCSSLTTTPAFIAPNVTNMSNLFADCISIKKVNKFETSKVTNFYNMFTNCRFETIDFPIDLSSAENIESMFFGCSNLREIRFTGDPSKITNLTDAFGSSFDCLAENGTLYYDTRYDYTAIINELKRCNPTWVAKINDVDLAIVSNSVPYTFELNRNTSEPKTIEVNETPFVRTLTQLGVSKAISYDTSFGKNSNVVEIILPTSNSTNFENTFAGASNLQKANLSNVDIQACTNFNYMFQNCSSLTEINLDNWKFNGKVTANSMFIGCRSLKTIYLRNSDETSKLIIDNALAADGLTSQVTVITADVKSEATVTLGSYWEKSTTPVVDLDKNALFLIKKNHLGWNKDVMTVRFNNIPNLKVYIRNGQQLQCGILVGRIDQVGASKRDCALYTEEYSAFQEVDLTNDGGIHSIEIVRYAKDGGECYAYFSKPDVLEII